MLKTLAVQLKNKEDGKLLEVSVHFSVTERSARKGINPRTKAPIDIPAKKVVKFKAGSELSAL